MDSIIKTVRDFGLWKSFNSASDIVNGMTLLIMCLVLLYMLLRLLRPNCSGCNKVNWFWRTETTVFGSGAENCGSNHQCRDCYK